MTVPRRFWFWWSVRLGLNTGITGGIIVGLIAGLGGSVLTSTLPDLALFVVNAFWLVLVAVPLVFWRSVTILKTATDTGEPKRARLVPFAVIAWLPAYLSCAVAFMIPVVVVPIVLNRGVSFQTSGQWYGQVETALLGGPFAIVGIATLFGFAAVAYFFHQGARKSA